MSSSKPIAGRFAVSKILRKPPRICAKAIFWSSVLPALTSAPSNSPRSRSGKAKTEEMATETRRHREKDKETGRQGDKEKSRKTSCLLVPPSPYLLLSSYLCGSVAAVA